MGGRRREKHAPDLTTWTPPKQAKTRSPLTHSNRRPPPSMDTGPRAVRVYVPWMICAPRSIHGSPPTATAPGSASDDRMSHWRRSWWPCSRSSPSWSSGRSPRAPSASLRRVGMDASEARAKRVQVLSTVLPAVAAIATAWCSYQASRWTAEYRAASGHTNAHGSSSRSACGGRGRNRS